MALRIVRGSTTKPLAGVAVGERRVTAAAAREVRFLCSACERSGTVGVPWDATTLERQTLIRAALDEHRRIGCTVRDAQARREYRIDYPRG